MRFVFAIVAFIAAAVMIGLGIAQRTVFLEPDRVSMSVELAGGEADFIVIEPEALAAHPGKQTITVSGSPKVFLSYGRTSDVEAWLGETPYVSVGHEAGSEEFTNEIIITKPVDDSTPVVPETTPPTAGAETETAAAPSPAGSDLWLDEITDDLVLTTTIDVPEDIAVLVSANGGDELPARVKIDWPLDNATPWAGPLIVGGALVFLIGIALVIAGFMNHRRMRGPRRNLPKGPRGKLPSAPKPGRTQIGGGRRSIGRAKRVTVVPFLVIPALALSACSADYWPNFDQQAAPATTAPATPLATTPMPTEEPEDDAPVTQPAVTVPQMERIMRRVAVFATDVDASRDATVAAERFTGPALEARTANYAIRGSLAEHPLPTPIPASPLTLTLPQQATGWPRTVLTIAKNSDDPTVAPSALTLVQQSPRENYKILYAISLAPDAEVPEVAPASIGAAPISPEFKGLVMPTGQVAAAYADVLLKGEASEFFPMFDAEGDTLMQQLGPTGQQAINDGLPATVDASYSNVVGDSPTIALATNDAGALVSVSIEQTENVIPNDGGTIGFQPGPAAALSGFTGKSAKGVQRVIGIQLLFYVPGVGNESEDQIRLLGWSESLIGASEVP